MKKLIIPVLLSTIFLTACGSGSKQKSEPLITDVKKEIVSDKEYRNVKFKVQDGTKVHVYFKGGTEYTGLKKKNNEITMFVYAGTNQSYTIKAKKGDQTQTKKFTIKPTKELADKMSSQLSENKKYIDGEKQVAKNAQESTIASSSSSENANNTPSNDSIQSSLSSTNADVTSVNGSYFSDNDYTVQIELKGREALTNKQTEKGMLMDIAEVWKSLRTSLPLDKFSNIGVSVKYPLTDQGGNSSDEYVIKSSISGAKLKQLNAENFDWHNVPTFATDWWQHDALPVLK